MKRIMLIGRSGAGKTTLTQAMKGRRTIYHKTQYINNYDVTTNTPGEHAENRTPARALVLYPYEADVVGLPMSATEDYLLYSPHIASMVTRKVIEIVTQIDQSDVRSDLAAAQLEFMGCEKTFYVSSITGEGVGDTLDYLGEERDVMLWEREEKADEASVNAGR